VSAVRPWAERSSRSSTPRARGPAIVALLLAACLAAVTDRAAADAVSDLEKAHNAYVAHKYDDAEARLRALLDPSAGTLKDADNIADARMYLGASLLARGKKADAEGVFEQLLRDKPDYQPDSLRVTLQAIDALIDVRSRMREELASIQSERVRQAQEQKAKADADRQNAALRLAMLEKLASEETVIQTHSRWIGFLPFGVGQFQNGQAALGWTFLAGESLLLVGSAISQVVNIYNVNQMNDAIHSGSPTASGYHARAFDAYVATDVFTAGFALVAIVGIIHAQVTFVPEHVQIRARPLPPFSLAPILLPVLGHGAPEGGAGRGVGVTAAGALLGVGGWF
jgi:tetratricopeptide (TPR) repeat protein